MTNGKTLLAIAVLEHSFFADSIFSETNASGADAINISGLLNPKKLGNFKNQML